MFAFRTSARPLNRAWYVELEPEASPFVAFAMKLETTNVPLFLEVEEANRFLLVMAHCGFSSQRCQRSGCAELRLRGRALCEAHWGFPPHPTRGHRSKPCS